MYSSNIAGAESQYDPLLKLISDLETELSKVDPDSEEAFNLQTSIYHYRIEAGELGDFLARKSDEFMLGET